MSHGIKQRPSGCAGVLRVVFAADQYILRDLEKKKILVFTPSRRVGGKRVVCYDDRFIVKLAHESDGIVVSNDTYRDLQNERPEWKKFIEERLLMYSFVNDKYGHTFLRFVCARVLACSHEVMHEKCKVLVKK